MASNPSSSRVTATTTTGVRRNLFHHHLSRRPTSASTSTSTTTLQETIHDSSDEIVAKDSNGNFQVRVPVLPPLDDDQVEESDKLDAKMLELYKDRNLQPGEPAGKFKSYALGIFSIANLPWSPELMSAVQANLKRNVASLADDNWIFEADQPKDDG
ncbi:MAG: hypothetical protein Q9163_000630 [Psora crenata]